MTRLGPLVIVLALGLSGCMATFTAHDRLVTPEGEPRSVAREIVFYALLPALLAVDVITAPFQYVHVITHAR